jgi:hypothetical protein
VTYGMSGRTQEARFHSQEAARINPEFGSWCQLIAQIFFFQYFPRICCLHGIGKMFQVFCGGPRKALAESLH